MSVYVNTAWLQVQILFFVLKNSAGMKTLASEAFNILSCLISIPEAFDQGNFCTLTKRRVYVYTFSVDISSLFHIYFNKYTSLEKKKIYIYIYIFS